MRARSTPWFNVTLSAASAQAVTSALRPANRHAHRGRAIYPGGDRHSGPFAAGQTTQTVTVPVTGRHCRGGRTRRSWSSLSGARRGYDCRRAGPPARFTNERAAALPTLSIRRRDAGGRQCGHGSTPVFQRDALGRQCPGGPRSGFATHAATARPRRGAIYQAGDRHSDLRRWPRDADRHGFP